MIQEFSFLPIKKEKKICIFWTSCTRLLKYTLNYKIWQPNCCAWFMKVICELIFLQNLPFFPPFSFLKQTVWGSLWAKRMIHYENKSRATCFIIALSKRLFSDAVMFVFALKEIELMMNRCCNSAKGKNFMNIRYFISELLVCLAHIDSQLQYFWCKKLLFRKIIFWNN